MKKAVLFFMAFIISISSYSCLPLIDDIFENNSSNTSSKASEQKNIIQINQSFEAKGLIYTAIEIERSNGTKYNKPDEGMIFIGVKFMIENISAEEKSLSISAFLFDNYVDDLKYLYSANALMAFGASLGGTLDINKRMIGYHALEVPEDSKILIIKLLDFYDDGEDIRFVIEIPQNDSLNTNSSSSDISSET